jgi:hypothetical protein
MAGSGDADLLEHESQRMLLYLWLLSRSQRI